jgi:glycosyltransferase involved in cell wall biosynthesis
MRNSISYESGLRQELEKFIRQGQKEFAGEGLRMDLHCHDHNSNMPDETLARLLHMPETWLSTDTLIRTLKSNAVDVLTVTNHNNARSCWNLLDKGEDVLSGAEFSCTLPGFHVGVHVLTFGFTPDQETKLNRSRKNLYQFLEYTASEDIPTVLAHPLHFYSPDALPPLEVMDHLALLFERFEGVNGQRDAWQNLLTSTWVSGLDAEAIEEASKRTGIKPNAFCKNPYSKRIAGGSDCHMGLFAGTTGTLLHAPGWRETPGRRSEKALAALRAAPMTPYGGRCGDGNLAVAFLDLFCQAVSRLQDPGLLEVMSGRGTSMEKAQALFIANGFYELRRHKSIARFMEMFHQSLHGKKPSLLIRWMTPKAFKPVLNEMKAIAEARMESSEKLMEALEDSLPSMSNYLNKLVAERSLQKIGRWEKKSLDVLKSTDERRTEKLPLNLRELFEHYSKSSDSEDSAKTNPEEKKASDDPLFPLLASIVVVGVTFAASKTLFGKRRFLTAFSERHGILQRPRRVLWLVDTLEGENSLARSLRSFIAEVRKRNLPIDFMTCGTEKAADHLRVLPSLAEFNSSFYSDKIFHLPGFMDVHKAFLEGGYDRIVCSSEAPMGLYALYLKHAFSVPAYFFAHSDWQDFAHGALRFDTYQQDLLRMVLSRFYREFDGVFHLDKEQRDVFSSSDMGIPSEKLFSIARWTDTHFYPRAVSPSAVFPGADDGDLVLLYAGRLGKEQGVLELPEIFRSVRIHFPRVKLAIAGTGPCLDALKGELPDAIFMGLLAPEKLAEAYSAATIFLFPCRFDVFSGSLLEALSCGLPVIAYRTKGPRDILADEQGGLLADGPGEMSLLTVKLLENPIRRQALAEKALDRSLDFQVDAPVYDVLEALGMPEAVSNIQKDRLSLSLV